MCAGALTDAVWERFYGSLKDEEAWTTEYDTRTEAIDRIDAWIADYRTEHPTKRSAT